MAAPDLLKVRIQPIAGTWIAGDRVWVLLFAPLRPIQPPKKSPSFEGDDSKSGARTN